MALAQRTEIVSTISEVTRLREKIDALQRRRADTTVLPVPESLQQLFPDGGLRPGATYAVHASTSLLLSLLSAPSQHGSWCAVVGLPHMGLEAAKGFGVALERLVLVPHPGERWLSVAAALSEVIPVLAIRPTTRAHDAEIARLSARLRDRGGVLLIAGSWPQAEVSVHLEESDWTGLGQGHGVLQSRTVTVYANGKRFGGSRSARVQLPSPQGVLTAAAPISPAINDDLALLRGRRQQREATA